MWLDRYSIDLQVEAGREPSRGIASTLMSNSSYSPELPVLKAASQATPVFALSSTTSNLSVSSASAEIVAEEAGG